MLKGKQLDMVRGLKRAESGKVKGKTSLVSSTGSGGDLGRGCSAQDTHHSLGCRWVKSSSHRAEKPALPLVFKSPFWGWPTVKTNQAVTFDLDSNNNLAMSTFSEVSQLIDFGVIVKGALVLLAEKFPALSPFQFAKTCADTCTMCVRVNGSGKDQNICCGEPRGLESCCMSWGLGGLF